MAAATNDFQLGFRLDPPKSEAANMATLTPKPLGDKLREVRTQLGLSIPDMAAKLKIAPNTLGSYEREERSLPQPEFLADFATVTGADLAALLEARLAASERSVQFQAALRRIRDASSAVARFALRRSGISAADAADLQQAAFHRGLDEEALEREFGLRYPINKALQERAAYISDFVYIPLYDMRGRGESVTARAGEKVTRGNGDIAPRALAFNHAWVRQALHMAPDDLRLIFVETDSEEPDLRPGDIIVVDYTDTKASREGIYVISMDGAILIKRLQRLPGGIVKVTSKNAAYEPFTVAASDLETHAHFSILGRVVIGCRRF